MAKSNYPHKQRSGGSNRGALIALLVLLIIAAAVFLLRSCTDGKPIHQAIRNSGKKLLILCRMK